MEVQSAGEEVGAGKAFEREVGAVGAAADGLDLGLYPRHLHRLHRLVNDVVMRLHLLAHIIILVFHHQIHRPLSVLFVHETGHLGHHLLAGLEPGAVMVTDDIGKIGLLHAALERNEVKESFIALRVFRPGQGREHGLELLANQDGVFHLSLGVARVHIAALDVNLGAGGIEVLKLQFAHFAAVHGIGIIGPEALHIELDYAAADFLIGRKPDHDGTMLAFGMRHDVLHRVHDFGHAGLVVGPQQGGAVGGDEGLPHIMKQFGELLRLQLQAGNAFQGNGASVIGRDDLRLHIFAARIRCGIDMGDEPHGGHLFFDVRGDASHNVAELVQRGLHAHLFQLLTEQLQQVQLLGRRRLAVGILVRLRVHRHVAEESVQ